MRRRRSTARPHQPVVDRATAIGAIRSAARSAGKALAQGHEWAGHLMRQAAPLSRNAARRPVRLAPPGNQRRPILAGRRRQARQMLVQPGRWSHPRRRGRMQNAQPGRPQTSPAHPILALTGPASPRARSGPPPRKTTHGRANHRWGNGPTHHPGARRQRRRHARPMASQVCEAAGRVRGNHPSAGAIHGSVVLGATEPTGIPPRKTIRGRRAGGSGMRSAL